LLESSIISWLIGGYQPGVEATPVDHVASSLAGDVIKYYPTLTLSKAQLAGVSVLGESRKLQWDSGQRDSRGAERGEDERALERLTLSLLNPYMDLWEY